MMEERSLADSLSPWWRHGTILVMIAGVHHPLDRSGQNLRQRAPDRRTGRRRRGAHDLYPRRRPPGAGVFDGSIANNTPISTVVDLGATRVIVLPTGFSCAIDRPPLGALAMALHALNLLIARQMVRDAQQFSSAAECQEFPGDQRLPARPQCQQ
jgi:hypothetical protein